jgi:TRAP-type C4-dicarboxylate transport system permease small subunit
MILEKINKACGYIAGGLVLISAVVILYDVVCRYAFNSPSLYAPYLSAFLILAAIFVGTAYTLQAGGHVHVEIIVDKLRPLPRKICFTIGYVFSMVFVAALTKACWQFSLKAIEGGWKAQGNLPVPSIVLYGIMTLGSLLLLVTLVAKIIEIWKKKEAVNE